MPIRTGGAAPRSCRRPAWAGHRRHPLLRASLVEGLDGEPLMGKAFPGGQGFPDLHAVGDLASARIAPWQPDTLWLLADLVEAGGVPSPLCMRGVLRRVTERLASHGLCAMVASEPEFYVLRVGEGGAIEHYSPLAGMAYTTGVRADPTGLVRAGSTPPSTNSAWV
jgi:glutamine synthetase